MPRKAEYARAFDEQKEKPEEETSQGRLVLNEYDRHVSERVNPPFVT